MSRGPIRRALFVAVFASAFPSAGYGAETPTFDGATLPLVSVVPFVGLLMSIAILPLAAPRFWHHHFGKVAAAWSLSFLVPFALAYGPETAVVALAHTAFLEYIPFIIVLLTLFTVAGGVLVRGNLHGTPATNTALLAVGTGIASWTGTTGAAMLLIRPVLRANDSRRYNAHVVIFFVFLVANIGGSLTPLGDPPLFLGFLKGVDFFWPTVHMLGPMALASGILLVLFFIIDSLLFSREEGLAPRPDPTPDRRLRLEGWTNVALLAGVVGAVLMSGVWQPGISFSVLGSAIELQNIVRDALLVAITYLSWTLTPKRTREANGFSWFPIVEVAKLFAGIFVTIIPAIAMLRAGREGALAPIVGLVTHPDGRPNDVMYFWLSGGLSSFLDNAPTYLVFFNTAGGDADRLMTEMTRTLLAVSAGSVFMGANTYIGNAPNFMVKTIAEEAGIRMPSFFGYMLWSGAILIPLFVLVTIVFFR